MKNKSTPLSFKFVVILLLAQAGCAAPQPPTTVPSTSVADSAATLIPLAGSTPDPRIQPVEEHILVARSLDVLTSNSDAIVIGQMTGVGEIVNGSRDINDVTKPDPNYFSIGQVYHFRVERYLKSQGKTDINVVQSEGFLTSGIPQTPENIATAKQVSKHIPLRTGVRYLYFLRQADREFPGQNYYGGIMYQPNRFILPDTGLAVPDSEAAEEAKRIFISTSTELINEIDVKVNGRKSPTATPGPSKAFTPGYLPTSFPVTLVPSTPTKRPYP